ncbi:hypothetical protein D3C85_729010 [compost metagenome]
MRRQAAGSRPIRPLAVGRIGLQRARYEDVQRLPRPRLARRPDKAARPVGPRRVQAPVLDRLARCAVGNRDRLGRRQRVRGLGRRQQGLQEGREHLVGLPRPVQHRPRSTHQRRVEPATFHVLGLQPMGDVSVAGIGLRLEQAVHEDPIGARLGDQATQLGLGVAPSQDQPPAASPQGGVQRTQRLVQPPARRSPQTTPFADLVRNIERQDRPTGRDGGVQGRIVIQPQVATEPQDDRGHGFSDQGGSPAHDAGWSQAPMPAAAGGSDGRP